MENVNDDQPVVGMTEEENYIDMNMVINETNKIVATVNAQNVSVFAFPKPVRCYRRLSRRLLPTSCHLRPKKELLRQETASQISGNQVRLHAVMFKERDDQHNTA